MQRLKFLLILIFIGVSIRAYSQNLDYVHDSTNIRILLENAIYDNSLSDLDTSLDDIHRYNMHFLDNAIGFIGGYGNAVQSQTFDNRKSLWLVGGLVNGEWQYQPHELSFYQVRKPFTRITYHNGPKREQEIEFVHTQNLNESSNVAAFFRRFSSDGFYQRQRSVQSNAGLNFNYVSRTGRYRAKGHAIINIGFSQENGGIIFDSTFAENTEPNRLGVATYLAGAENEYDTRFYGLNQYFILCSGDSLNLKEFGITLDTDYSLEDLRFEDVSPVDSFYAQYNLPTSVYVSDKIQRRLLSSTLGLRMSTKKSVFSPSLNLNNHDVRNLSTDTLMYDVGVGFSYVYNSKVRVDASGIHYVNGFANETFRYKLRVSHALRDSSAFRLYYSVSAESWQPGWEHIFYENSLEVRRNNLSPVNAVYLKVGLTDLEKRSVSVSLESFENYTYFDSTLTSNQHQERINILEAEIDYKLSILDPVFIEARFRLRHVLTDGAPINLPLLQSSSTIYIEKPFFKKALQGRVGFDVYHFTSFFGDGYMPLGRRFYYQENEETGGFIYVDAFLSLQIGRARGFVKLSNITSGITPYNYVLTPRYPLPDGGLRFGISWDLMN